LGAVLLIALVLAYGENTPRSRPHHGEARSYAAACDLIATAYPPIVPPTGVRVSSAEANSILSALKSSGDAFLESQVAAMSNAVGTGNQEQMQQVIGTLQGPCSVRGIPPVT
jgi:hypothetical protein